VHSKVCTFALHYGRPEKALNNLRKRKIQSKTPKLQKKELKLTVRHGGDEVRLAVRQRAGLVQHHRVHRRRRL